MAGKKHHYMKTSNTNGPLCAGVTRQGSADKKKSTDLMKKKKNLVTSFIIHEDLDVTP